jgi:hypothetical protein
MSIAFKETMIVWALTTWEYIKKGAKWYWRRYARETLCFLCGFLLALIVLRSGQTKQIEAMEARLAAAQVVEVEKEPTDGQKISLYRNVARALYGIRDYGLSNDAKRAYIQVMLNRADPNVQYDVMRGTDDLASVLAVPNQWQGYRSDGNYTEADFQLVKEFLESGQGNILNSDKYYWCEIKPGYIICKADINGKTNIPDQVVQ